VRQVWAGTRKAKGAIQTAAIKNRSAETSIPVKDAVATFKTGKVKPHTKVANRSART